MIEVTEEEKRLGRNHVEIIAEDVDIGYFEVDFVLPEDRLICGWWIPSKYVRQEMIKRNLITDVDKPPFWSAITYEFANDLRFNYGFFEIDKGVPQFNLLTDTVIDCVPKKEEIFGSDTTIKQYKDFIHMVNNQVTKLVQLICYNINVMDDGR